MMQVVMITLQLINQLLPELFQHLKTQFLKVSKGLNNLVIWSSLQVITVFRLMNQLHQPLTTVNRQKRFLALELIRWIVQAALHSNQFLATLDVQLQKPLSV